VSDLDDGKKGNFWTTLPGILTALATLITAIAGFLAIMNRETPIVSGPPSPSPTLPLPSSNLMEVKFNVYTEDYQPIEFVEIQFLFDGAPAPRYTDRNGYVNIEIPASIIVSVMG
jgi:hypothetical protein